MMLATQSRTGGIDSGQFDALIAMALAARGGSHERRVLASTLKVLAAWLSEQARLLGEADHDDRLTAAQAEDVRTLPRLVVPRPGLTRRERQIASRIARGFSNRQIAEDLVIATSTTERHVANILAKLDMRSRTQIATWAIENGL